MPPTRLLPLFLLLAACSSSKQSTPPSSAKAPAPAPAPAAAPTPAPAPAPANGVLALTVADLDGKPVPLSTYKGQVLLVVNVASECGFTPQYEGLEKLERELAPKGFHVLGFPCNQFGGQEPGGPAEIRKFCTEKYQVSFPLFAKVEVKDGAGQAPLYKELGLATGKLPTWNFCKYLVGKDGAVRAFYPSKIKPEDTELRAAIDKELGAAH